ncbi:unnamed protein product [Larinioides sclopetarius]|uniref:Solute carrier organic anion transporter family member n=1 Tax=Larinioides sclopetarius TaxID=280406 RepID=A0AAV2BU53_9ARAC
MKTENNHRTIRTSSSINDAYDMHESHSHEPLVAQTYNLENFSKKVEDKLEDDEDDDDMGLPCGWGPLQPSRLQKFRSARWVLFWLCWAGFLQGLIVNGFINVVITTIEKRYQLRSTESGLIAGGYDIASFLCLIPVSYLGGSRSKPVFIGSGVLVLALGSFVFSLPHYMSGPYSFSQEQEDVCSAANSSADCSADSVSHLNQYKYVFFLGQLLHGAGAAPFYTLGCTYLDENVPTKMSSVYLGIYYTMAVIGPAVGYVIGGQFLKLYVDVGVDASELGLTSSSSVWVGAWWIGFIFTAILGALVAIPLTAFPKTLPGALRIKAEKKTEMHQKLQNSEAVQSGFGTSLKDLPSSFRFLLTNPTFVFLSLAGATEGMLVSGLATFLPKVIESQFSIAASYAAVLVGLVTIPGAGGGTFLGGYLVKKLNLRCAGIIKMCIIFSFICVGLVFIFILHCPNAKFAGLNQFLPNSSDQSGVPKFQGTCNEACSCSPRQYDPVCGTDNIVYYSPCFAGCKNTYQLHSTKVYGDCACIEHEGRNVTINGQKVIIQASREKCVNYCSYMPVFLLLIFLSMLFTFLVSMPSLSGTLRCVAESQKSFALGVQWIAVRLLGTIPAPILFGSLIDVSCELWQDTCKKQGACLFYDNQLMSTNVLILACVLKSLSCVFFFFAWLLYCPPGGSEESAEQTTKVDNCDPMESNHKEIIPTDNFSSKSNSDVHKDKVTNGNII